MSLTAGTQNFWSQIKNYLLSSGVTLIFAFCLYGWQLTLTMGFFLFLCFIWLLSDTKSKLLRSLSDRFQGQATQLTDFPLLNFTWMQQQTHELEALGFVPIMDYGLGETPAFARCFAHPQQYCYAEVNQVFTATGELFSKQAVITSFLDKGWTVVGVNREANPKDSLSYGLWRNPQTVSICYPNMSLAEIFQRHLDLRQQMIADLDTVVLTDISWENYVKEEEKGVVYRKESLKRKNLLLAMIEVTKFEKNPQSEWWGDYAKFATKL